MDADAIRQYVAATFDGVHVMVASQESGAPEIAWGDTFFIYDPERNLPPNRQQPFATIVTKDYGDFDNSSNLDRPGVYRLNVGLSRETFQGLFGEPGGGGHDFTTLDRVMPHPVYGRNHWVCALNPSEATFEGLKPLLAEAYDRAVKRYRAPAQDAGEW